MSETKPQGLLPLIVADIYELAGRLRDHGERIAEAVGQTQARWQVMSAASPDPKTVPQIARRLGVSRQNVQRIADLLVEESWASFETNPDHRASPYLVLNPRGRDALDRLTKAADSHHARLSRKLAASELTALHRGLRRLLAATAETESTKPAT
jgi:DNA-binding MarR family transcriptional regulator